MSKKFKNLFFFKELKPKSSPKYKAAYHFNLALAKPG
jgi:hypothetical protein